VIEVYNDILCIQAGWLIEKGIISKSNYDKLKRLGRIKVVRRAAYMTPALVEWDSLPGRYKEKIKAILGGDPKEMHHRWVFSDYLTQDTRALEWLRNYRTSEGKALTDKLIRTYYAKIIVFNAITSIRKNHTGILHTKGMNETRLWKALAEVIHHLDEETYPHRLPRNYRRLKQKYFEYMHRGYEAILHGGIGNKNKEKLTSEAKIWALTRWADQVNRVSSLTHLLEEYNNIATKKAWAKLRTEETLRNYLYREDIRHLWWHARYGERTAKEKFTYHMGTRLPKYRDSLWYADGTKLNLYYLTDDGKIGTLTVYEVMDAYSEVFLGFAIGEQEDYQLQYKAFRMAVEVSGYRPYQISFDNQGGHRKGKTGELLRKLTHLAINTQPYNGKSKTIESAFGRFQQRYLKTQWNFTGMNITAKRKESHINKEFLLANKEFLPSRSDVIAQYKRLREKWNMAPHPRTGIPRWEMYQNSKNPDTERIGRMDYVELFWTEREKPVRLTPYGLGFKVNGVKRWYMKYLDDGITPDVHWLKQNIDKPFFIRFDYEDESEIYIYEQRANGRAFAGRLTPKIFAARGKQDQTEIDIKHINASLLANKQSRIESRDMLEAILETMGSSATQQGFNIPAIAGVESTKRKKRKVIVPDYYKEVSQKTDIDDDDDTDIRAWKLIGE